MLVAQSCPTLWNPMDCSPPVSSAHGILQARIWEWVVISFSRGSSRPRDWTCVSRIEPVSPALTGGFFATAPPRKPEVIVIPIKISICFIELTKLILAFIWKSHGNLKTWSTGIKRSYRVVTIKTVILV